MRFVAWITVLVGLWLLAWGEVTVANVVSGVVAAGLLLVFFPLGPPGDLRFHPLGALRLAGYVSWQVVAANVAMAGRILRPQQPLEPGVIVHRLEHPSEGVLTAMVSVLALAPGTLPVDAAADASSVSVHFLILDDEEGARRSLQHLEELVVRALGAPTGPSEPSVVDADAAGEAT